MPSSQAYIIRAAESGILYNVIFDKKWKKTFDDYMHDKNSLRGKDHFSSPINNRSKFMNVWRHKSPLHILYAKDGGNKINSLFNCIPDMRATLVPERSRSVTARTIVSAGKRNQQDTRHTWPEFFLVPFCTYVRTGRVSNRNWATRHPFLLGSCLDATRSKRLSRSTNRIFRRCASC